MTRATHFGSEDQAGLDSASDSETAGDKDEGRLASEATVVVETLGPGNG